MRLNPSEKTELEAGAAALGVSAGALMRDAGLEKARNALAKRKKPRSTA